MKKIYTTCFFLCGLLLSSTTALATTISLDPKSTYLRTSNNDMTAVNSIAIELASLGLSAGDYVRLELLGDYSQIPSGPDSAVNLSGVFSSTSTILGPSILNRIPDAIDAGADVFSAATFFQSLPMDIAEDFAITDTVLQIPTGAFYLFVAAHDSYYSDNSDPDGDYGVRITQVFPVSLPGMTGLIGIGLVVFVMLRRNGSRHQPAAEAEF